MAIKIIKAKEVRKLPIGTTVWLRKGTDWRTSKYKIVEIEGNRFIMNVHSKVLRTIKDRPAFHYEVEEK